MGLGNWIWSVFNKLGAFLKKAFNTAKPFIAEMLSKTAQNIWNNAQPLLMEAVAYVASQGLPTDQAKQDAFKKYMQQKSTIALNDLKDQELATIREMALAIWKKSQEKV